MGIYWINRFLMRLFKSSCEMNVKCCNDGGCDGQKTGLFGL